MTESVRQHVNRQRIRDLVVNDRDLPPDARPEAAVLIHRAIDEERDYLFAELAKLHGDAYLESFLSHLARIEGAP